MSRNREATCATLYELVDTASHSHSPEPDTGTTRPNAHADRRSYSDQDTKGIRRASRGNGDHGGYRTYSYTPTSHSPPYASRSAIIHRPMARPSSVGNGRIDGINYTI